MKKLVVILGAVMVLTGVNFLFVAIWVHSHDSVSRVGGTGGLAVFIGIVTMLIGMGLD